LKTLDDISNEHKKHIEDLNEDYQRKLNIAYDQHDRLVEEYEKTKSEYRDKLDIILTENKNALGQIESEYREKYESLSKNHIRLINDMKRDGEKFDVGLEQCEQEYENEL
jgi:DNA repair exonuclease SbcCD ATPase subunit